MRNWLAARKRLSAIFGGYARARRFAVRPAQLKQLILIVIAILAASCGGGSTSSAPAPAPFVHFVPNSHAFWSNPNNWTTPNGPAYANILLDSSNFLPCLGGPYALCYYSGPSSGPQDLSCNLTVDGDYANCNCYTVPFGAYFVDINAILNHSVYEKTVAQCGADGSNCSAINSAPVCQSINQGTLIPGAKLFSTFSFDCIPTNGIGQTSCATAPYAGCMTAPCLPTDQPGISNCSCPTFTGPYQVGQNAQVCSLGDDLVWSAAYAPPAAPAVVSIASDQTRPQAAPIPGPGACVPDAPGGYGCPLYKTGDVLPPGTDCTKVCAEYASCPQPKGAQAGYTCDSTLCTDECNDLDLVGTACKALAKCDISEIVKTESAAQCSCCASQLCGCSPDAKSNKVIFVLNQDQRDRGITPQCDINGTLCGTQ